MNYTEAQEYLETLQGYGIVPGLDSIRRLCSQLGNPQEALCFVHIAGTNGKGSVLNFIYEILRAAGYRVGRFTSPAIFDYREQIQVGGTPITRKALCQGLELVKEACQAICAQGYPHPTAFEVQTALAFWYYREKKCDIVLLECGMGGLGDTTNVIEKPCVSVIASVGMDHMQYLGKILAEIAAQKAGIIKAGCPVVTFEQSPAAMDVIENCAAEKRAPLTVVRRENLSRLRYGVERQRFDWNGYRDLEIAVAGRYQVDNAHLALETVRVLAESGWKIGESHIRKGLLAMSWPGRFQIIAKRPLFVVDGAHNEDGVQKLADSIEFYFTNKRIIYIMGVLRDKDYERMIALTHGYADQIFTVTPPGPRGLSAYELATQVAKVHPNVTALDSLEEAVEIAGLMADRDDVILAFGSLSYLGRLITIVRERSERSAPGRRTPGKGRR